MEGNKLDLSGKNEDKQPLASYKALPEADMEEERTTSPKAVIIKVKDSSVQDGADEKMLSDDDSQMNADKVDVLDHKVIIKEKNGDAKLEFCELKSAFAGIGKEELMKYANDPFWVTTRWILFIVFWVLWFGMLVGAVCIIYTAPKCDPPPPRRWWEEGPLAEIKADTNPEQLKVVKESGIKGLILEWPEDTYAELNDTHYLINLLKKANETGIPIILDLEASMSNIWFEKSEKRSGFEDYYIWKASNKVNASGIREPPNNWISRKNESSWKYSSLRKEFYYAPEGWPQLNFRNVNVTEEFIKVLKNFAAKGVKGFRIRDAHILLVDSHFEDQLPDTSVDVTERGYFLTDYGFYIHSKTEHLLDLGPLLYKWRKVVKNITDNGPFMVKNFFNKIESYKVNNSLVVDLPPQANIFSKPVFDAGKVVRALEFIFKTQGFSWPLWEHKSTSLPVDVLDSIIYLLPGVPLIEGDVNKELLTIRDSPPIMRGEIEYKAILNKTVLAFSRIAPGSPGILVAVNPTNVTVNVNLEKEMDKFSSDVTFMFISKNFKEDEITVGLKQESNNIPISAKSSIVVAYTVKKELDG